MKKIPLGKICRFEYGKSLPEKKRIPGEFMVYGSNGPVGTHIAGYTVGKTIIIGRKGSIGEINLSEKECWPIDTTYFIDESCTDCDLEWLAFTLIHNKLGTLNKASGIPGLNRDDAYAQLITFPDTKEQQLKIAARLRAQLAEVEKARSAAEAQLRDAVALEKAILHTIEEDLFSNCEIRSFGSFVYSYRNGFGKRPKEKEKGPIVLRIADVSTGFILTDNPRQGEVTEHEAEIYRLNKGDLLFIRVNGAKEIVGKCCVVDSSVPTDTIFNDHLIRVQLNDELNPEFARLCVSLPRARQLIEEVASTSAGQLTINQQLLDRLEVPIYPIERQEQMTIKLKVRLDQLSIVQNTVATSLNEINLLPQKILAQAFEI